MLSKDQLNTIKKEVEIFFEKMTIPASLIEVLLSNDKNSDQHGEQDILRDIVNIEVKTNEPQILIGQQGQTLFEIQRILRMVLNKKTKESFYINLDINEYKKKKVEYLKDLAKSLADQVALNKEQKTLLPMSAYERRIIHTELAQRTDVITESSGDGSDRHIIIKPK